MLWIKVCLIYSVVVYKMPVIHLLSIKVVAHINCCFFQRMQITNIMYFFPYKIEMFDIIWQSVNLICLKIDKIFAKLNLYFFMHFRFNFVFKIQLMGKNHGDKYEWIIFSYFHLKNRVEHSEIHIWENTLPLLKFISKNTQQHRNVEKNSFLYFLNIIDKFFSVLGGFSHLHW